MLRVFDQDTCSYFLLYALRPLQLTNVLLFEVVFLCASLRHSRAILGTT